MNSTDSLRYEPDHEDDLDGASEELGNAGFRMRNKKHGFHDCTLVNRPIRSAFALMLTIYNQHKIAHGFPWADESDDQISMIVNEANPRN